MEIKNKKVKKVLISWLLVSSLLFSLVLFYNKDNKKCEVSAQENGTVICGEEIPIGEALEETFELSGSIRDELFSIEQLISQQIEASEAMIDLANQCDINKCQPVCHFVSVPCGEEGEMCQVCQAENCAGQICPENEIKTEFDKISEASGKIKNSRKKIKSLIDDKQWVWCWGWDCLPGEFKTKTEIIQEKLDKSREEFDECFLTKEGWEAVGRGESIGKILAPCNQATDAHFIKKLSKECEDVCEVNPESPECQECAKCKSDGNFVCCHIE